MPGVMSGALPPAAKTEYTWAMCNGLTGEMATWLRFLDSASMPNSFKTFMIVGRSTTSSIFRINMGRSSLNASLKVAGREEPPGANTCEVSVKRTGLFFSGISAGNRAMGNTVAKLPPAPFHLGDSGAMKACNAPVCG